MPSKGEKYYSDCFVSFVKGRLKRRGKSDLILSCFRNIKLSYSEDPFCKNDRNEADLILFEGEEVMEVEVKKSWSDFLNDYNAIMRAAQEKGFPVSAFKFKEEYKAKDSKFRKHKGIFSGKSIISFYSILLPSYVYSYLSKEMKGALKSLGIGIYTYIGEGKIREVNKPFKRKCKRMRSDEKLRFIMENISYGERI